MLFRSIYGGRSIDQHGGRKRYRSALTTANSYIDVVVNATFFGEGKKIPTPCLLKVIKMGVKQTVRKGVQAEFELGKFLQDASKVVSVIMKQDFDGLGYKPNAKVRS